MRSCSVHVMVGLILVSFCAVAVHAQSAGIVRGGVTDANEAGVMGAIVTLVNATNVYRQETTTDEEGRYTFFNVPFNAYTLSLIHISEPTRPY